MLKSASASTFTNKTDILKTLPFPFGFVSYFSFHVSLFQTSPFPFKKPMLFTTALAISVLFVNFQYGLTYLLHQPNYSV